MKNTTQKITRRSFLTKMTHLGLGAASAMVTPSLIGFDSAQAANNAGARRIALTNKHTGETFSGVYRVGDKYLPEAFDRLNIVLRDFRTGEAFPIDPRVIDIIYAVHERTGVHAPYDILSGYRSPKTNNMLRKTSTGVAKNSLHMTGQAIDLHLPHYSLSHLRNIAKALKAGGVGYYPRSNFVHMDSGDVRSWS